MPLVDVRIDELTACARELAGGARRVADAAGAFDRRASAGAELGHPVAMEAYERFFAAWSLRLHDVVAALDDGAQAVLATAGSYAQWERYVADLAR